jgi:hypothetical protein
MYSLMLPHCRYPTIVGELLEPAVGSNELLAVLRSKALNPLRVSAADVCTFAALYDPVSYTLLPDAIEYKCPHTNYSMAFRIHAGTVAMQEKKANEMKFKINTINDTIIGLFRTRDEHIDDLIRFQISIGVLGHAKQDMKDEEIAGRNKVVDRKRKRDALLETVRQDMEAYDETQARSGTARARRHLSAASAYTFGTQPALLTSGTQPALLTSGTQPAAARDSEGTHARRADADEEDAIDASLENDSGASADRAFINSDYD